MEFKFDWDYIRAGSPYVTISSLAISFNSLSIKQLDEPEFVLIGFDEEKLAIGIKAVSETDPHKPYEFRARKNKDGWIRVGCKEFIQRLEILTGQDFSQAKRFPTKKIKEGFIIVELNNL